MQPRELLFLTKKQEEIKDGITFIRSIYSQKPWRNVE